MSQFDKVAKKFLAESEEDKPMRPHPGHSEGEGAGGKVKHVEIHPEPGGSHSVHAFMHGGTVQSSTHGSAQEAMQKAGEHLGN